MNKLAILAFSLLIFFSTMMWYLANGSLNDYLKSQVTLQSHYYTKQAAELTNADYSNTSGQANFQQLTIGNLDNLTQPHILQVERITAQLAASPTKQLDSPSIQKKTTTLVTVNKLQLHHISAWSEVTDTGKTNIDVLLNRIEKKLAIDYPALYPQIAAKMYAEKHPERSEKIALSQFESTDKKLAVETNEAIIASNAAKQKKRLLGKAQTRIKVNDVTINDVTVTIIKNNTVVTKSLSNISLGSIGGENGLASNQLGGEILQRLLYKLATIEKSI